MRKPIITMGGNDLFRSCNYPVVFQTAEVYRIFLYLVIIGRIFVYDVIYLFFGVILLQKPIKEIGIVPGIRASLKQYPRSASAQEGTVFDTGVDQSRLYLMKPPNQSIHKNAPFGYRIGKSACVVKPELFRSKQKIQQTDTFMQSQKHFQPFPAVAELLYGFPQRICNDRLGNKVPCL